MSSPVPAGWGQPKATRRIVLGVSIITLVALALRLYRIADLGDLDFDEQASSFIASMDPLPMVAYLVGRPFEHPPAFYLAIHYWMSAFGQSETALRWFAVVPGTLAVFFTGLLVGRVSGPLAAWIAAWVVAISPLQVFESRDARMYSLLGLLTIWLAASVLAATGWWDKGGHQATSWRSRLLPGVISALSLATHYYALFAIVGCVLGGGIGRRLDALSAIGRGALLEHQPARVRTPIVIGLSIAVPLLGLPLVWLAASPGLRLSLTAAYPRFVDPAAVLGTIVASFGAPIAGPLATDDTSRLVGWGTIVLVAAALVVLTRAARAGLIEARTQVLAAIAVGGFLALAVAVPLLMVVGRAYAPRFVSFGVPLLATLLGIAAAATPRRGAYAAVGVYTLACGVFLAPMLGSYVRSDYGKALSALRAEVRADDAVVLNGPWQDLLYQRYGWGLPHGTIIASRVPLDPDESIGWLERLAAAHSRIWVVDSATDAADPDGVVAGWLDSHAYPRPVIPYEKAILRPYLTDLGAPTLGEERLDVSALDLSVTTVGVDAASLVPGGEARLRIRAVVSPGSPPIGRRAVVDLIAPSGLSVWHWDGPLTSRGETLEYRAAILIPASASPGVYTLRATPYETDAHRNPTRIGDAVTLTTILVATGR